MTEELRIVMEAMAQLGVAGKEAFIWWLVITYGAKLLISLMVLTAALGIPYIISRTILKHSERGRALREIGEKLGVNYWSWTDYDVSGHSLKDVMQAFHDSGRKS